MKIFPPFFQGKLFANIFPCPIIALYGIYINNNYALMYSTVYVASAFASLLMLMPS